MEITKEISITGEQINQLEMHSVINVITVIISQLQLIQLTSDHPKTLESVLSDSLKLAESARAQERSIFTKESLLAFKQKILNCLNKLSKKQQVLSDGTTVSQYMTIFEEIFRIILIRAQELNNRWLQPDAWESFPLEDFHNDFMKFFHALEKNSKGKYRIITNIADQEEKDYLVQFSAGGDTESIHMPILFKDVIRDLIANARKYTPPGGKITVGISQKNNTLRFVVEDNGYGIPKDELSDIIEFGYRGSNVKNDIRTMGGGFGLTKAWYVTQKFGGRFWIESEINEGTKITIDLPVPQHAYRAKASV